MRVSASGWANVNGRPPGEGWEDVSSPVLAAFIGGGPGRGWALVILLVGVAMVALVALLGALGCAACRTTCRR